MEKCIIILDVKCKKKDRYKIKKQFIDTVKSLNYWIWNAYYKKQYNHIKDEFYEDRIENFEANEKPNVLFFHDVSMEDRQFLEDEYENVFSVLLNSGEDEDLSYCKNIFVGRDSYLKDIEGMMRVMTKEFESEGVEK